MNYIKLFENFDTLSKLKTYSDTINIKAIDDNEYCRKGETITLNNFMRSAHKDDFKEIEQPLSYPVYGKRGTWIPLKDIINYFIVE